MERYSLHPNYADGLHLFSCPIPFAAATFQQVVGRDPRDGEWVRILNEAAQTYTVTTFRTGLGWDNGDPALNVGQAAWFDLGPVVIAEPSTVALAALSILTFMRRSRQNRRVRS